MTVIQGVSWNESARKQVKQRRAFAIVDYALAVGHLDEAGYRARRHAVMQALVQDMPSLLADLPGPQWDSGTLSSPIGAPERKFAVALLDSAEELGWLNGADRKWRVMLAVSARTAADLLALFLDVEPHLRDRDRSDPALTEPLGRLALISAALQARAKGRISRDEMHGLIYQATSGEFTANVYTELRESAARKEQLSTAGKASGHTGAESTGKPGLPKDEPLRGRVSLRNRRRDMAGRQRVLAVTKAKRQRAFAMVDYALAVGHLDEAQHRERRNAVAQASAKDLGSLLRGLPRPGRDFDEFERATASGETITQRRAESRKPAGTRKPDSAGARQLTAQERAARLLDLPPTDLDRARITKHLEKALFDERLGAGEHASRMLTVWSATTRQELADLVVDLPVTDNEPLRDRKRDHHSDNLVAPRDRLLIVERLEHAMAAGQVTLREYEARLVMALTARTYGEIEPAVADIPGSRRSSPG